MRYISGEDSRQTNLLPSSIDEVIGAENAVRLISVFVDSLDVCGMGFKRSTPAMTGRPPYDPKDLLKLYIYGYVDGIRSSRKLERESGRNIELWWLLNKLSPDHNTIADFRKDNAKALKRVFKVFVRACAELQLVGGESVCIDSTTMHAVNGRKQATTPELTRKKLDYAKSQLAAVEKYLLDLDQADLQQGRLDEPMALDLDPEHLPSVEQLKERIKYHEGNLRRMEETGENQLLFTDPEARMMRTKEGGTRACYNIQTATDARNSLIVGFTAGSNSSDRGQLFAAAQETKDVLGTDVLPVIADKGYESAQDIEKCLMNGIIPDVGFIYDREERVFSLACSGEEITQEQRLSTKAEDIQSCLHAGILPACYEHTNISIQLQEQSCISCFIRHEDGHVTCPIGRTLYKLADKKYGTDYSSKDACRTCPNRCTDSKAPKTVRFGYHSVYVPVRMYGDPRYSLQQIPDIEQSSPYHRFGRVKQQDKRVMIFIKRDKAKQKKRMEVSEHPFGTVKWYDGAHYFLCKGREKVTAETALSYLGYDIRRAVKILGVPGISMYFRAKTRLQMV